MADLLTAEQTDEQTSAIVEMARWVRGFDRQTIPAKVLRQAKLLTLDTIGCGLAGRDEEVSAAVLRAIETSDHGPCSIIGTRLKCAPADAVLANGVLVRLLDLNDYVIGGLSGGMQIGGHPSDNIPVALAFGEKLQSSGEDILKAIVIGYEVYGRMREMMGRDGSWDGVTISGFVAPAMAGFLSGLDAPRLAHAIALSAARAPTSSAVRSGDISAAKSIANSLVAQSGVIAFRLAEQGVTGPLSVIDHTRGLRDVFTRPEAAAGLTVPLAERCYIMMSHVKDYPALATGQTAVAAGLQLHKKLLPGDLDRAQRIEVAMADYPFVRRQQDDLHRRRPLSREAADHSFNFLVAVSLLDGEFGLAQFDGERWTDPRVKALMAKMVMVSDAGLNERAPGSYPCALRLLGKDGLDLRAEVGYPHGYSRDGIDEAAVVEKFHRTAGRELDQAARERVIAAVMKLDQGGRLDAVFAALQ